MDEDIGISIPGYRIENVLGAGGMAKVYLAVQQGFDRQVALKVISPQLAADEEFGRRFLREARIVGNLSHSHIVPVYDVGEVNGVYYLSMETLPGGDLKERLGKGVSEERALLITEQMASALNYAHKKGFIHRDVKPDNVLFRDEETAVLTDFGIARTEDDSGEMTQITQVRSVIGSPKYMSPEQAMGHKLDARTDIYSLGIMLYEMLTGSVPYEGRNVTEISLQRAERKSPQLPANFGRLQPLLTKMLAYSVDARYQDCQQIVDDIRKLRQQRDTIVDAAHSQVDETVVYHAGSDAVSAQPSVKKSGNTPFLAIIGILLVAGAGGAYFYLSENSSPVDVVTNNATPQAQQNEPQLTGAIEAVTDGIESVQSSEFFDYQSLVMSNDAAEATAFIQNYPNSFLSDIILLKTNPDEGKVAALKRQSDENHARSQLIMSELYDMGWAVDKNVDQAIDYARMAATSDNEFALYQYAMLLLNNEPNKEQIQTGVTALTKTATSGFYLAQTELGNQHLSGVYVEQNIDESIRLFELAAEQGDRNAIFNLAYIYDTGAGLDRPDLTKAQKLFKQAEALGHTGAAGYIQ